MGGKGPPRCQHVVTDVTYYVKHNGYLGLEKAYVSLTLTEVPEDKLPIMQTFKINFYKSGETDIFRRSGRPGYVVGEPVMAGKLTNIKTDTTTAALQAIELHSDRNKWLTVVSNTISGSCVTSPEQRSPVTFGEEMRAGCKISVSLKNMTDSCAFIQDAVLGALRGIDPPTHVATFGDSQVSFVGDWVEIIGLYTQPPQAQRVRDGVCRNLVVGMLTEIIYADIGALQHPQAKIIGVLVTYQTAMVKFQCIGKFCQPDNTDTQTIEVVSSVSYIDASSSPVSMAGETPTLPVRLPSDFFYPFT